MKEVRALQKCLMSHSFTSCSRICEEGQRGAQKGCQPPEFLRNLVPRTQPGMRALTPEKSSEGSVWGRIMPGRESLGFHVLPL